MLKIYNTLSHQKEEFRPVFPGLVSIYVCGLTADDVCHVGHGRTFMVFDTIIRYLSYRGFKVNYVRNITDIEDKIIEKSFRENKSFRSITQETVKKMHQDFDRMNIIRPTHEPLVTHHIREIIELIEQLLRKKHAYISYQGDVLFSVKSCQNYGILSHKKSFPLLIVDKIRKDSSTKRKHNMDFALWKIAKPNEPNWPSPWGDGRPGWHIECSTIIQKYFGNRFDIHGGGEDLIFPHHENELAQSTCLNSVSNVNIWMHTGMVMMRERKMSKSLNNTFPIRELLNRYDSETIRYFFLSSHYRSRIQFDLVQLERSKKSICKLYSSLIGTNPNVETINTNGYIERFNSVMDDDFNTPKAIAILFEISKKINRSKRDGKEKISNELAFTLRFLGNILGFFVYDPKGFFEKKNETDEEKEKIVQLVQERDIARKKHQWDKADEIRRILLSMGIKLEDRKHNTIWRKN